MNTIRRLLIVGSCTAAALALIAGPASAGRTRMLIQLDALELGVASGAWGINNSNVAVGWSNVGSTSHAVKWEPGKAVTDLGTLPGGSGSAANAINDGGTVVGEGSDGTGNRRAIKWAPDGTATALATPQGDNHCKATAINNQGVIVGQCSVDGSSFGGHAVRWSSNGAASVLGMMSGHTVSNPSAINPAGKIVGWSRQSAGHPPVAVTWSPDGTVAQLEFSGDSEAYGVNDLGQAAGRFYAMESGSRAVRWETDSRRTAMGALPDVAKPESRGMAITSKGAVVGDTKAANGRYVAAVWTPDGTATKLASLFDLPPGTIDFATAVNNSSGSIVGSSGGNAVMWTGYLQ
ncbi:putative HAF family extracellular repeat protein [Kibdelosporangium banguiense]|uniref:HAF family extracellular repeat protein n=1 Tax=Kibdelosporangium banguiense TaxID=1365924 RepID=A0ABS4TEP3_9PSEU|nr:hypothetical protein [Kibdelosporangium banguiense]MBP2322873.1 putative HAF family extracellular repeat protein [Kibdelosporangium banguiense]